LVNCLVIQALGDDPCNVHVDRVNVEYLASPWIPRNQIREYPANRNACDKPGWRSRRHYEAGRRRKVLRDNEARIQRCGETTQVDMVPVRAKRQTRNKLRRPYRTIGELVSVLRFEVLIATDRLVDLVLSCQAGWIGDVRERLRLRLEQFRQRGRVERLIIGRTERKRGVQRLIAHRKLRLFRVAKVAEVLVALGDVE